MAFTVANGASSGSAFFKPKDHGNAHAILIEPKAYREDVQTKFGLANRATADFTIFNTQGELDAGKPGQILEDATVEGALAKNISKYIDSAVAGTLDKITLKNGNSMWVLNAIDGDDVQKIVAYATKRDEEEAEALPDFF